MTTSGMKRRLIASYMSIFSLTTPIGIAIGIAIYHSASGSENLASHALAQATLNGLATGTLIYVVFFEILERERKRNANGLLMVCI